MKVLRILIVACLLPVAAGAQSRLTTEDYSQLLQAVLDHGSLAPFLHPEVPGRLPVKVTGVLMKGATVQKFGKPVEFLEQADSEAVLIIRELLVEGPKARVVLVYPIEGVSGRFVLSRGKGGWKVDSANVLEH